MPLPKLFRRECPSIARQEKGHLAAYLVVVLERFATRGFDLRGEGKGGQGKGDDADGGEGRYWGRARCKKCLSQDAY